jgi:flagellar motor switch protein FliN
MEQNESAMPEEREAVDLEAGSDETFGWEDTEEEFVPTGEAKGTTEISKAEFHELGSAGTPRPVLDVDFILDIPLTLTVELGRSRLLISELLQLGQGSVVELTKLAGEPMDIFVNQRLIARGEVVVVNEKFGVRLTDIISPAERVNRLR